MIIQKGLRLSVGGVLLFSSLIWGGAGTAAAAEGSVYNVEVKPLTVADCARCHTSQFNRIKDQGAKHTQVVCTDCHEVFHAYNPLKNNYAQIMPKCASCHDAPHGTSEAVMNCLTCHQDPHQPLVSIPVPTALEGQCRICHTTVAQSLRDKPSKHTAEDCSSCHSQKHGRIPVCSECHESHSPKVEMGVADCLACHPVHTPLQISYPLTQNKEVCGGCHEDPYNQLAAKQTKHSALTCAKCHPSHGQLMACQECHGEPHSETIHQKYLECGICHKIAHDLEK